MTRNAEDWLDKYYPVEAEEFTNASDKKCVEHALLKWQGLVDAKNYNLSIRNNALRDEFGKPILWLDGESCSLCKKYYRAQKSCEHCPLAIELGTTCDQGDNLYERALNENPQLMVDVLSKILEKLE